MSQTPHTTSFSASAQPRHIAIIMDGNGRWAQNRGLLRAAGHQAGFKATRKIVESCGKRQIQALTLFAFSSENWQRPESEVGWLMDLFLRALQSEVDKLQANNVRIRFIGERSAFSKKLQQEMQRAETLTTDNTGLKLSIAVNYGGRWDIVNAARQLAAEVATGEKQVADITIDSFSQYVCAADCGEPDLFIRTGGETRISNYLLWQLAYTEMYFTDVLWPDFSDTDLAKAVDQFATRQRRFGKTGEQISGGSIA